MTFFAFLLITGSVLLHALWHFISKSSHPTVVFFIPVSAAVVLTGLPLLLLSGIRPWELPASVLYPIVTGGSIVFSAILGKIFFKEILTKYQLFGILLCFTGTCLFI